MFVSLGSIGIAADEQTPAKSVETGRLKVGFGRRIIRVAAAIATLLLMITAALRIDREQNYCKAYVNDKLVTDQSAIMSHVAGTMNAIDEAGQTGVESQLNDILDRKSTRLNSSHANISYAVFCLKKKKNMTCVAIHMINSA